MLRPEDQPVHDWYRFVLSFPPHLVRTYIQYRMAKDMAGLQNNESTQALVYQNDAFSLS